MKSGTRVAAAIAACALAAACGGSSLLAKVKLNEADLPKGVAVQTIPGGYAVRNQVTLDLCGAEFPSEELRDARLQQSVFDQDTFDLVAHGSFSIESVVYDSAASGAQAFAEIRSAVENCPDRYVPLRIANQPLHKFKVSAIPDADLGQVAPEHIALDTMMWDQKGGEKRIAVVYQRRGRVLVGLYSESFTVIEPYIPVVASRLAALTPAEAGE